MRKRWNRGRVDVGYCGSETQHHSRQMRCKSGNPGRERIAPQHRERERHTEREKREREKGGIDWEREEKRGRALIHWNGRGGVKIAEDREAEREGDREREREREGGRKLQKESKTVRAGGRERLRGCIKAGN